MELHSLLKCAGLTALTFLLTHTPSHAQVGGGTTEHYRLHGMSPFENFGAVSSSASDVDGDGVIDFFVSTPEKPAGIKRLNGEAAIFSGADGSQLFQFDGTLQTQHFGNSVDGLGDIDGDGLGDFIIGAPWADLGGATKVGAAFVYSGYSGSILFQYFGQDAGDELGHSVACAGDVDADGISDFIIGALSARPNRLYPSGVAYVYSGATGLLLHQFESSRGLAALGSSVDQAGDVNQDGFDDVIVGAMNDRPGIHGGAGSAFVFSGFDGTLLYHFEGEYINHALGSSVAGAGDVNNDGIPDFLVGASGWFNGWGNQQGAVYIYSGADGRELFFYSGESRYAGLGKALSFAGDINFDGHADFFLGAPGTFYNGVWYSGAGMIYNGATGELLHQFHGDAEDDAVGCSFAFLDDINGDGIPCFVVGAKGRNQEVGAISVLSFDPYLTTSAYRLSRTAGGTVTFDIDFPTAEAGAAYGLLLSKTGAESSGFLGGTIPLVQDALFQQVASGWSPPFMANTFGTLDANGNATASLTLLPNSPPALIDTKRWFAAVSLHPGNSSLSEASVAVPLKIIP